MPPATMLQRFCTMLRATGSSQVQVTFMPPWHFSNFSVQRGTIIQLTPPDTPVGAPIVGAPSAGTPMPGIPIPVRSIIIVLDIPETPLRAASRQPGGTSLRGGSGGPSLGPSPVEPDYMQEGLRIATVLRGGAACRGRGRPD